LAGTLCDANGELRGYAKVTRDLTERRSTEGKLRASEARLRMMLDSVKDYAIFMLDANGRVQTWNTGARAIKGYTAEEIVGSHFSRFYPPEDVRQGRPQRELQTAARAGTYEEEGWRVRRDGSRFWANVLITAIRDESGELTGYVKVTRDLTERRESERVRSIVENVVDGIITVSEVGLIESFNRAAERMFAYAAEEVLGQSAALLLADDDIAPWSTAGAGSTQVNGRRKDGTTFPMELALGEFHFLGRRGFTIVVRDVTERQRYEEKLRASNAELQRTNQELDDFAYIASHDLKEPLRGIHNYANFLIEDYAAKLDDAGRAKLETLARLAQRMEELIDSLLQFSRVGRLDLERSDTDLNALLRQALGALHISLTEARAEVRVPRSLPKMRVDPARVTEVFQNLVANAVKYNDKPQKWVEIGAEERDGERVLYVRDNGVGIPARHHDAVFRIFKRLHGRDKFGGGTGAGLTIVKKIIERHGGRIWIDSEPGNGSTFYFTLGEHHGGHARAPADSSR
jgi:PAS domain S-box-containing protein